jgi:hypothetical protein
METPWKAISSDLEVRFVDDEVLQIKQISDGAEEALIEMDLSEFEMIHDFVDSETDGGL